MELRDLSFLLMAASFTALPAVAQEKSAGEPSAKAEPTQATTTPRPEATKADSDGDRGGQRNPNFPTASLRVQLVISRFQADKKIASMPYTFVVGARQSFNPGRVSRMRMGIDTPVPQTSYTVKAQGEPTKAPTISYQYKNVGTNIDCWAVDLKDGSYQLQLNVENSSALTGPNSEVSGAPLFRRFETFLDPVMRDGQTIQAIASTDPVTGEVVKIDVTLNVVK